MSEREPAPPIDKPMSSLSPIRTAGDWLRLKQQAEQLRPIAAETATTPAVSFICSVLLRS